MKNYEFYRLLHARRMTLATLAEQIGSSRPHVNEVVLNKPGHGGQKTRRLLAPLLTDAEKTALGWLPNGKFHAEHCSSHGSL